MWSNPHSDFEHGLQIYVLLMILYTHQYSRQEQRTNEGCKWILCGYRK